jgi:uncharacterized RDD family membrane protein YckC
MTTTSEAQEIDGTRRWWLGENGQVKGPFGTAYVVVSMKTGKLRPNVLACVVGTQEWRTISDWPELCPVAGSVPPPLPTQTASTTPVAYAGFWDRVRAAFLDGVIVFLATGFGGVLWSALHPDLQVNSSANDLFVLMASWMYFAAFESSGFQATLGKKAMGIKVTDLNGERISFGRATVRYFAKALSTLIFLIGWFMVAFTSKKQALHDILASCLVVYRDPPSGLRAFQKDQTGG